MRINANKKIHKMKRDPYRQMLRVAGILAIAVVVGIGIFGLCSFMVNTEYHSKREAMDQANVEGEQEFNAKMAAARSSYVEDGQPREEEQGELRYWEATLGDALWRIEDDGRKSLENTYVVELDRATLINGGLLLVNPWHSLPTDFSDLDLVSIGTASGYKMQVQDNTVRLFPLAYDALAAMIGDAEKEELKDYMVREAYRSMDMQLELFNARMERLSGDYSGVILIEQTKKYVNYPGNSEFQTGLSFRMDLYNRTDPTVGAQKFQESAQGKWFTENAWKYGIIFRFPTLDFPTSEWEDKSYKTGVSQTMNLYRYVGKAHAAAMRTLGYCMEEYVEFLMDHSHISIYKDGALQYEIIRLATEEILPVYSVPVPNPASSYQASLDNMGGVVLAYTYNQQ